MGDLPLFFLVRLGSSSVRSCVLKMSFVFHGSRFAQYVLVLGWAKSSQTVYMYCSIEKGTSICY